MDSGRVRAATVDGSHNASTRERPRADYEGCVPFEAKFFLSPRRDGRARYPVIDVTSQVVAWPLDDVRTLTMDDEILTLWWWHSAERRTYPDGPAASLGVPLTDVGSWLEQWCAGFARRWPGPGRLVRHLLAGGENAIWFHSLTDLVALSQTLMVTREAPESEIEALGELIARLQTRPGVEDVGWALGDLLGATSGATLGRRVEALVALCSDWGLSIEDLAATVQALGV